MQLTPRQIEIVAEQFRAALQAAFAHDVAEAKLQMARQWLDFWEETRDELKLMNVISKELIDVIQRFRAGAAG